MSSKAILVARVSTKEQEEGHSITAQKQRLGDYCARKGLTVVRVFEIIESSTRGERKAFAAMLDFANPPQPYDIARALRVFNSKVQYVDITVENYRFSSRRIELPPELLDITDEGLRSQISGRFTVPASAVGPFDLEVEDTNGTRKKIQADERWLTKERKRIEDKYTYIVPRNDARPCFVLTRSIPGAAVAVPKTAGVAYKIGLIVLSCTFPNARESKGRSRFQLIDALFERANTAFNV